MTQYNFSVSVRAENAVKTAYEWYEQQRSGLGMEYIEALNDSFVAIRSNPMLYSFRKKSVRGCVVRRFPYLVLFYVSGSSIKILNVFHTSQKRLLTIVWRRLCLRHSGDQSPDWRMIKVNPLIK